MPTVLRRDRVDRDRVVHVREIARRLDARSSSQFGVELQEVGIAVPIPIKVEFRKVFDSLFSALQKPETEYKISGTARLGPISVPFDKVGKLNWTEKQ